MIDEIAERIRKAQPCIQTRLDRSLSVRVGRSVSLSASTVPTIVPVPRQECAFKGNTRSPCPPVAAISLFRPIVALIEQSSRSC